MTGRVFDRFPPHRLRELGEGPSRYLRILWYLVLLGTLTMVACGTVFVLRDAYQRDPLFGELGFTNSIESDGSTAVESELVGPDGKLLAPEGSRIVGIDGVRIAPDASLYAVASILETNANPRPLVIVQRPDGSRVSAKIERGDYRSLAKAAPVLSLDARMALRMVISLIPSLTLILCAVALALRRRRDPVCQLFSFAFLLIAATIDPPLNLWMALGWGEAFDLVISFGWTLLVIGIASFPDGRFEPRWMRWLVIFVPLMAVLLSLDDLPVAVGVVVAFLAPLALLWGLMSKYRRYDSGIERQQIKWGALGFASGLVTSALAFALMAVFPFERTQYAFVTMLGVLALFNLGFMLIALGLLVALIRFRLWEADKVISRSAIFGGLALVVGALWAASVDLIKIGVEYALGEENKMLATAIGAMLAAGLFGPAQALLMKRTRRKLDGDRKRIDTLIGRLGAWRSAEAPREIAQRTLASLSQAIHCGPCAVLVDAPLGRELLAARDLETPQDLASPGYNPGSDPRFVWRYPLEDDDGPVGLLLIGPRSDANRYNADERAHCELVLEPLAEALRVAMKRSEQEGAMQRALGVVEERLRRLEGGPSPAGSGTAPA